jgi:hypothetical protein
MRRTYRILVFAMLVCLALTEAGMSQDENERLEKLRAESGVDPTRVLSRLGYSFLIYDRAEGAGKLVNKLNLGLGVSKWSFGAKYEAIALISGEPGTGFQSGFGDLKFSVLNSFYDDGLNAFAGAIDFTLPTGKPGFGSQYFKSTPSISYARTVNPGLILALQTQYEFDIMKDPLSPELSVLTFRAYVAKFISSGYFFVLETRPVIDMGNDKFDLIFSPIAGKDLGGGFNLVFLAEVPVKKETADANGILYQFGFSKSF